MPTNRELEIIMRLKDEVTKKLQNIEGALRKFGNNMKALSKDITKVASALRKVSASMILVGGVITGAFAIAIRTASQYSLEVDRAVQSMNLSFIRLQISIAQAVVPILNALANVVSRLTNWFYSLDETTRSFVLQAAFLTGIMLTLGGAFGRILASLIQIIAALPLAIGNLAIFASMHPYIIGITAGLAAMAGIVAVLIIFWDKLKGIVQPFITTIEIALNMVLSIANSIASSIWALFELILMGIEKAIDKINKLPMPKKWHEALNDAKKAVSGFSEEIDKLRIDSLQMSLAHLELAWEGLTKGTSAAGDELDKLHEAFDRVRAGFGKLLKDLSKTPPIEGISKWASLVESTVKRLADTMSQSLGNFFYNVLTKQITSAKDAFIEFGQSVLRILTDVLAKLILELTLAQAIRQFTGLAAFSFFHKGGMIRRAHRGFLASDEVPIIAQAGEGIITKKGVRALGGSEGLARLNRGEPAKNADFTLNPTIVIQAFDAQSGADYVVKNKDRIGQAVVEGIIKNKVILRKTINKYCT